MVAMFWITATPRNVATGAAVTVRLAGGGAATPYYRSPNHFRAGIVRRPRFTAKAEFGQDGLTGGTVPTTGKLRFKPSDKALLAQLGGYFWKEAPITVEAGPEGGPYSTILTGTVVDVTAGDEGIEIEIADLSQKLNKPLVTARFAGTGGVEGGPEAEGRPKRRSWGRVFNVEGRVLDKTTNVYEFGDPAFQVSSFAALRDMGRAASPAATVLAWQGSAAATLTALKAAACSEGSGVVAASIQCAKWWTQPAGPLTADLLGETTSGYVETAPSIAARICAAAGGPAISNSAAMDLLRPEACGLHVGDGNETAAEALDRLLLGVSLLWVLEPAGTIVLRELSFDAPVETITSRSVRRLKTIAPIKTRRVGYQKSQRQHSDAEISVAIVNLVPFLTNEAHTLPADSAGVVSSYAGATGQFRVYSEGVDVSSSFTLATAPGGNPQALAVNYAGQTYTVTGGLDAGEDNATLTIRATGTGAYVGITRDKVFSLGKSKGGATGADAKLLAVISDRQTIYYDSAGSPSPAGQTTTFTAQKVNTTATVTWSVTDIVGNPRAPVTNFLSSATGNSVTMTEAQFASARNGTTGVIVTGTLTDGPTLTDKISVVRVAQGAEGPQGPQGPQGAQGVQGAQGLSGEDALAFVGEPWAPGKIGGNGDFVFYLDMTDPATTNVGEIYISGSRFNHPDGTQRTAGLTGTVLTSYGEGETGRFFLVYSQTAKATRFSSIETGAGQGTAANVFAARIKAGGGWEAFNNSGSAATFTPLATDCIIAVVEAETTTSGLTALSPFVSGAVGLDGAPGAQGEPGLNNATVFIFKRAATEPALPTASTTYTFATKALTGLTNGWTTMVPAANGSPLWVSAATASSNSATDAIAAAEWAAPVIQAQDGTAGLNTSLVYIYKRAASSPALPTATATYTFATGGITGLNNGWTATVPASDGNPLYVALATASAAGASDTIATGEWSAPTILAQDGAAGAPGQTGAAGAPGVSAASVFIYQRAASAPALPSASTTFTFATGVLTGLNNGWSQTIPAGTNPLYVSTATAAGTGATDTIAASEWAAAAVLAENGTSHATVFLFKRTATNTAPALPSAAATYTFATGVLSGITNGWTQTIPPDTDGAYLWGTTATALATAGVATDSIAASEWAAVRPFTDAATIAAVESMQATIAGYGDDGIISSQEKRAFISQRALIDGRYLYLVKRAAELGLSTSVTNLLASTAGDLSTWSTNTGVPLPQIGTVAHPYGGEAIPLYDFQNKRASISYTTVAGKTYAESLWIYATHAVTIRSQSATGPLISLMPEWQRLDWTRTATGTGLTFYLGGLNADNDPDLPAGIGIAIWNPQTELGNAPSPPITPGATADYLALWRANYVAAQRMVFPPIDDSGSDGLVFPWDNELPTRDLSGWTPSAGASRTALDNGLIRVTDAHATVMAYLERNLVTPAGTATMIAVVYKDGTGRSAGFPRFALLSASHHINLDTNTGAFDGDTGTEAVWDGGDFWIATKQATESAGTNAVRVYPARGASSAWADDAAAARSIDLKSVTVFFGALTTARRRGSWKLVNDAFAMALEKAAKAISGSDATTGLVISPLPETVIECDYQGNIKAGQLPRDVGFKASVGNALVTSQTAWSEVTPAGFTATIGAATGVLNITTPATGSEGEFTVTGVYNGVTREVKHRIRRKLDDPPAGGGVGGGGGGTSSSGSDSSLGTFASTTPTVVSAEIEVTAATTTATLTAANLSISTDRAAPEATLEANGKWQRAVFSGGSYGAFADVTTPTTSSASDPDCSVVDGSGGEPGVPPFYVVNPGSLTVNRTSTVVVGTKYKFRLLLWLTSGTRTMIPTGTASVTT